MKPEELISKRSLKPVFEGADSPVLATAKRNYRVKRGDNLTSIAKANRVDVKDLQRWNNLTGKNLKAGQTLVMQDTRKRSTGRTTTVLAANNEADPVQGQARRLVVHGSQALQRRDATPQALEPSCWPGTQAWTDADGLFSTLIPPRLRWSPTMTRTS